MLGPTLKLKHKKIAKEVAEEAARKAVKETKLKMLMEMKKEGISEAAIIRVAQIENIPEEEVKKILGN